MRLVAPACLALALLSAFPPVCHADLRHYWSRLVNEGGSAVLATDYPFFGSPGFAIDGQGDLFVALDVDSLGTIGDAVGPGRVIARLDATGGLIWARRLPPVSRVAVAGTGDGGVVMSGGFYGTVDFGGGPMTALGEDVFLVKLDPDGLPVWQRRFGGNQGQRALAVAVDGNGHIVITGSNSLLIDFGGGSIRSNGSSDVFIAKFDGDAGHLWSRGMGSTGSQQGLGLALGMDNRIALVIEFEGASVDFGGGQLPNVGGSDVAAAVLDEAGALLASVHAGSPFGEGASDIALDPQGNVFLCGSFTAQLDLGGGLLTPPADRTVNGFAASYDPGGAYRWSYLIPDSVRSLTTVIGADGFGNCFVIGRNDGPIVVGLDQVPPSGVLLLGLDPAGVPFSASGFDMATTYLRVDQARDRIVLAATVFSAVDFGGGALRPQRVDVALAELGVRRSPQVTFSQFGAQATDEGVRVVWSIDAGELLDRSWLSRRTDNSANAEIVHAAPAGEGDGSFIDRTVLPGHVYTYRLTIVTRLGDEVVSDPASVTLPAATAYLEQNAPNPFNPVTHFVYSLAEPANVSIVIYDQRGALVARLYQGMQPAGKHRASWGGHNARGEFVASGVYFYRLEGVPDVGARKMILLK